MTRAPSTAAGTVDQALSGAVDALAAAGVETPRLDAEVLLAEAIGGERAAPHTRAGEGVDPPAARRFGEMVRRRLRREPVAYILGRKGFRRIELAVDRRVLIPRPETELLVEIAVEVGPSTVLDVGTGSGAIALAIADELSNVLVRGVDTSPEAIELARENARRLGVGSERVEFEPVARNPRYPRVSRHDDAPWDLVLANLPYVADGDWATLQPEIRDWEPREAVIAGPDGLDSIRGLLDDPPRCRSVALEVGLGQAATVEDLVREAGFPRTERRKDLAGIDRVVVGHGGS